MLKLTLYRFLAKYLKENQMQLYSEGAFNKASKCALILNLTISVIQNALWHHKA